MAGGRYYTYSRLRKRRALGGYGGAAFTTKPPPVFTPTLPDTPAAPPLQTSFTPEFIPPPDWPNPSHPGTGVGPDPNYPNPGGKPPTGGGGPTFDPTTDPIYAAVIAQNERDRQIAHAAMLAAEEKLLQAFGDPDLARKLLGANDPTIGGISSDYTKGSTSTLARLKKNYADTVTSNEDQLNKANLFYSGARVKRLSDLSYQNQARIGDATTALDQAIQAQQDKFNAEKQAEADRLLQALDAAYSRWLSSQINSGGSSGSSGSGGNTPPAAPPPSKPPASKAKKGKKGRGDIPGKRIDEPPYGV